MSAYVTGQIIKQTVLKRAFRHPRIIGKKCVADFTRGDRIAKIAFAQQLRNAGVGDGKGIDGAIGLFDGDFQIAVVARCIEIADGKLAWGNHFFIEGTAGLLDGDRRVAVGKTTNDRRIAAHGIRQHAIVGGESDAANGRCIKHLPAGVEIAQHPFRLPGRNSPAGKCLQMIDPFILNIIAEVQGVIGYKTPRTERHSGLQVTKEIVAGFT